MESPGAASRNDRLFDRYYSALIAYGMFLLKSPALADVARANSRRDYGAARRFQAREWWDRAVPEMRLNDHKRYVRNFRVPPSVVDELVE